MGGICRQGAAPLPRAARVSASARLALPTHPLPLTARSEHLPCPTPHNLQVGPGGTIGGMMWGSASDNERVYVSNNNFWHRVSAPNGNCGARPPPGLLGLCPWLGHSLARPCSSRPRP